MDQIERARWHNLPRCGWEAYMREQDMLKRVGMRVVALSHLDPDGTAYVFGHGVYEGRFPIGQDAAGNTAEHVRSDPDTGNPRIRLDDGRVVWGAECWWIEEAVYNANLPPREVPTDLDAVRREPRY